jgi:ABC-type transport system substrate-binding protein
VSRAFTLLVALLVWLASSAAMAAPQKVLRYAFPVAETSFDPAQITDVYSRTVAANIFDAPLEFEYFARPARVRPNTAAALPEVSADFTTFTFSIRPGIFFADDPAFGGKPRELVAADYVYSLKRHFDPRWKSGNLYIFETAGLVGMAELRREAIEKKQPLDYDREVEGLRALDRYRFQLRLSTPDPRFHLYLADPSVAGALAREVVEAHGPRIGEHPVGTGPYRLVAWKRSSRMVLERNPGYRERLHDENPNPQDERLVQWAEQMRGRRLPIVDRVEISVIEEMQPRWLSFLGEEQDLSERVPEEFADQALPNNQLAPHLARRGIQMQRYARADVSVTYFGMENPVVGGYAPERVALRRAISLAADIPREIRLVRRGQAVPAQSFIGPQVWGYDAAFKSEMSEYSPARAKALLDLHGYVDRDGDGWRERPDGSPLLLEIATQPDQLARQMDEQWKKNLDGVGLRSKFNPAKWPENLKASRAGKLMMWNLGWSATVPDAEAFLALAYGPNKGQANHARFDLPAYNALYKRQGVLPNGPERQALIEEAKRLTVAYMPLKVHVHRIWTDLAHPWVKGYHRNVFVRDFWKFVDVDMDERAQRSKR